MQFAGTRSEHEHVRRRDHLRYNHSDFWIVSLRIAHREYAVVSAIYDGTVRRVEDQTKRHRGMDESPAASRRTKRNSAQVR